MIIPRIFSVNIFAFNRYDEENCNADDWQPFNVSGNGIAEPFSKPASPIKAQFIYQDSKTVRHFLGIKMPQ